MFRPPVLAAILICVLPSAVTLPVHAQPKAKEAPLSKSRQEILAMMQKLEQPIETKFLHEPVKLKVALECFCDMFGGKLTILTTFGHANPIVQGRYPLRIEETTFSLHDYQDFLETQAPDIARFRSQQQTYILVLILQL